MLCRWQLWPLVATVLLGSPSSSGQDDTSLSPPTHEPRANRWIADRSEKGRATSSKRLGGNARTEDAVEAALDWLLRHQQPDGRWDADGFSEHCTSTEKHCTGPGKGQHGEEVPCPFDAGISAFAALAFLGHGVLPSQNSSPTSNGEDQASAFSDRAGPALHRALSYLLDCNDVWSLAIGTEAIAEAAVLTGDDVYREAVPERVAKLLKRGGEDGGFGYATGMRKGSDVPYTALVVVALLAARDAGVDLPEGIPADIDRFLDSLEASDGKLAYLLDGRSYGYTPTTYNGHCAAALRECLKVDLSGTRHRAHLRLVCGELPRWKLEFETLDVPGRGRIEVQLGNLSMLQWYFGLMAMYQAGGQSWKEWFGRVQSELVDHQENNGCKRGSWEPLGTYERQTGGRVLSTALGALMLEQPCRHLRNR